MLLQESPEAAFNRGNTSLDDGDPASAIAAFEQCLRLAPDHPATLFNLGNAQLQANRTAEGAGTLLRCLRVAPDFPGARVNLATALFRLGLLDEARGMAAHAISLAPNATEPLLCHAAILHHAGEYARAAAAYVAALRHAPRHPGALSSLGNTLRALGRIDAALDAHDRAVAAAPTDPTTRFNRALTLLAAGRFTEGWREYEWRWQRPGHQPRFSAEPWRGEALNGRTILLHAEQGLGDTLQFARYAPMVAQRGGRVILEVQPELARLLRDLPGLAAPGFDVIVPRGKTLPRFDLHCPLMSLPLAFGTTPETIPPPVPYRATPPAEQRTENPSPGPISAGIVWAGAPHRDDFEASLLDRRRSLPPAALAGLADMPRVTFVSLQKDAPLPAIPGLPLIDIMAEAHDFADTAAMINVLDLVIAVDTSVAHLAATMGKPVWLLSRYDGCWRWMQGRENSPWYPTMRIYRQKQPGDWTELIARVRRDLDQETGAG